jgi:hypothetical protein
MASLSEFRCLRSGKQCNAAVRGPIAAVVEPSRNGGKRRQIDERDAGDANLVRLAHRRCEIEVGDRDASPSKYAREPSCASNTPKVETSCLSLESIAVRSDEDFRSSPRIATILGSISLAAQRLH